MPSIWERASRRLTATPRVAIGIAAILLLASFGLGVMSESARKAENLEQARVQAEILAGSLAAPLAFNDVGSAEGYLSALGANPAVEAAGAYDTNGHPVATFRREGAAPPTRNVMQAPVLRNGRLVLTVPVMQGTTTLGSVYVRARTENFLRRSERYVGIGLIVVMASLLIGTLGASHASLADALRKLQEETRERQKAEAALRQSQKMEAMGQLTGGVAHDFNNLLMVASSGLDLMERTSDPARRERLKQSIRQAIDRGANLTQQLLAFARKAPLKTEVVDLGEQLRGMEDVLQRSLREDIRVEIEAIPNLWPVEVDPAQFEVAVLNIALNARDAMPMGGTIRIKVENLPAGGAGAAAMVRLAIRDAGVGMAPELVSRIFEPFFTTKGVGKGTGLGLSQVYGFARAAGGDVEVQSQAGVGTTVALLLPRSEKSLLSGPKSPRPSWTGGDSRARVLLVEDDDRVAELVQEMLDELGYAVTRTSTAAAALDQLRADQQFDVVFSDMVMPGEMSGLDLARKIIDDCPDLPVVLTSGYSQAAARATAEGLRLLVKPYRIEALGAELSAALGDRRRGNCAH